MNISKKSTNLCDMKLLKMNPLPKKKKNTGAKNLTKNKKGPDNIPDEEEGVVDLGESYADNVC